MKKILVLFIYLFLGVSFSMANERDIELNRLFNELKEGDSKFSAEIEKKIWKIWTTHPNNEKLTILLAEGSDLVNKQELKEAVDLFSKIIDQDPKWAEAWNKRATVLYLLGEFEKSQNDIEKVLELEERHFGALAGQGLVNIQLKNYEKAILSYKKAKKIHPAMKSSEIMIKEIEDLIKMHSI